MVDNQLDVTFHALADPTRRGMLASLALGEKSIGELAEPFSMTLAGASKHVKVLEDADLIIPVRKGRERWNHLNPLPIHDIHERWVGPHAANATARLAKLKREIEQPA